MPELPEVELVTQALDKLVAGRRIIGAELLRERLAPDIRPGEFAVKLRDAIISRVRRRGKHILFELDNDQTLIVHLRMSGRFQLLPAERERPNFTHAVFYLNNENTLVFTDQRHFGFMRLVETAAANQAKEIRKLAPEPLSPEFSREYFRRTLKLSSRSLKEFLLDQSKVCGLGNIYAAEALFLAHVDPLIPANRISSVKAHRLHGFIREVLRDSIAHGSTLNVDPENIDGSYYGGAYENRWLVYDREGEPCANCGKPIRRLKQAGRSTYFCPKCQRSRAG